MEEIRDLVTKTIDQFCTEFEKIVNSEEFKKQGKYTKQDYRDRLKKICTGWTAKFQSKFGYLTIKLKLGQEQRDMMGLYPSLKFDD
jgi:hypothetical protein